MKISVTMKDRGGQDFVTKLYKEIEADSERLIEIAAKRCESVIRYMIENKTNGGTGNLANSDGWIAEPILGGWGVGDIPFLNANQKYWRHLNDGSEGIGADWEHYLPKGLWVNGRWVTNSAGYSGIKPKTPIQAVNYIEATLAQMEVELPKILQGK